METDVNAAGDAKTTGSDWLMQEVYKLVKKLAAVKIFDHGFMFNNTEIQMMKEIVRVKEEGGRIISSRLAKELGITRSAVSQMVNKLEKQNIVMRVPDERDKKIAYIELSSDANVVYEDIKGRISAVMSEILAKLGEEKVRGFLNSRPNSWTCSKRRSNISETSPFRLWTGRFACTKAFSAPQRRANKF